MSRTSVLLCFVVFGLGIFANSSYAKPEVKILELKKGNFSIKVSNYGATLLSVVLPDKNGKLGDIVLGYDTIKEYMFGRAYFGAIVGRVANRIGGAKFTLDGTLYKLIPNDGNNTLHGGKIGYSRVVWTVKNYVQEGQNPRLTLGYYSYNGEQGFPGDLQVTVTYAIMGSNKLSVIMKAEAVNKPTPVNLAQHSYWNLAGEASGQDILSDEIQIFGSHITPTDAALIPTGVILPINGTPFDFLQPRVIGTQIGQVPKGYDINYALDGYKGADRMIPVAEVHNKKTGRVLHLSANQPGVQFYTANMVKNVKGKGGSVYGQHSALCLETQGFPDAVNHPNFPSQIVVPGKPYQHHMLYSFTIKA